MGFHSSPIALANSKLATIVSTLTLWTQRRLQRNGGTFAPMVTLVFLILSQIPMAASIWLNILYLFIFSSMLILAALAVFLTLLVLAVGRARLLFSGNARRA